MKKASLKLFSIFFILATLVSCDNEPLEGEFGEGSLTPNTGSPTALVGQWKLETFETNVETTGNAPLLGEINIVQNVTSNEENITLTFTENSYTSTGSCEFIFDMNNNGIEMQMTQTMNSSNNTGTYSLQGDKITYVGDNFLMYETQGMEDVSIVDQHTGGGEETYQLSDNNNTLTFINNKEYTETQNGIEMQVTIVGKSVWKKLTTTDDTNEGDTSTTND